jgi:hypothetical protein
MIRALFILTAVLLAGSAHAINRCVVDGKVVYSERPCPTGTTTQSTVNRTNAQTSREAQLDAEARYLRQKNDLQARELEEAQRRRPPATASAPASETVAPKIPKASESGSKTLKRGMSKADVQTALGRPSSLRFGVEVPAPLCENVGYAEEWTYASSHSSSGGVVEFCRDKVVYFTVR